MKTDVELPPEEGDPCIVTDDTKPVIPEGDVTEESEPQASAKGTEETPATATVAKSSRAKRLTFPKQGGPKGSAVAVTPPPPPPDPFKKATPTGKRLKLFLWGDTFTGKTTLALQFPGVSVIDMERGTDHYAEHYSYNVKQTTNWDEMVDTIRWLATQPHDYRTLVIDPFTVAWESLMDKWNEIFLRRNKSSKGYKFEYYSLQPLDRQSINAEARQFLRLLLTLDMNVILIARAKPQYAEGEFMKKVGDTFDAERRLPYLFDSIVQLYKDEHDRHLAYATKDRTRKLPQEPFEVSYALLEQLFGKENLARPALNRLANAEQIARLHELIDPLNLPAEELKHNLGQYNAESFEELTAANADIIINKLTAG